MRPELAELHAVGESIGLPLTDAQALQLCHYLDLLGHWNKTFNLTAVRDRRGMLSQHLSDCMAAVPAVRRWVGHRTGLRVLDVGSGGGLPGLVWAALMPTIQVHCVDAVGKKAAFIRQAAGELGLPVCVQHARVEALEGPGFDLVTSRAFASLDDFSRLTRGLLTEEGVWLAMKGKVPEEEMAALDERTVQVFHVEQLRVPGLDAERCLVWMKPLRRPPE